MAVPVVGAGVDAGGSLGVAFTRTATESASPAISSRAWTIVSGPLGIGATIDTDASLSWVPGASLSGSNDIRQPKFQEIAFEFTSTAENSTLDWSSGGVYRYIEDIGDDRGYTGGLVGFTTGTFDLEALVQHYSDISPGNVLEQYLPDLATISAADEEDRTALAHSLLDPGFVGDWEDAADNDPLFARAQRDMREEMYWAPSLAQASADGVGPLGLLILWDIYVNHGEGDDEESFGGIVATAQGNADPPSDGGNETNYLNALVDARADVLAGWDPEEDLSIGRVGALRQLIDAGKLTLATPLSWDMYEEPFSISTTPFPPDDSCAGTYVLRYSATNADGTGTDTMTLVVGDEFVEPTPVEVQRLYLSATLFSDPPSGFLVDWDSDGLASAPVALTTAPSGDAAYLTRTETTTTSPFNVIIGQWVSGPALSDGALVADQDWPITMGRSESDADANLVQAVAAWIRGTDGNYRATVFSYFFSTEWPVGATPLDSVAALFTVPGDQIPDDVAIAAGEQLVVEVGYRATNTTASPRSGTIILGGTDTPDLANGDIGDDLFRPSWVDVPTSEGLLFGDDTGEPPEEDTDTAAGNFGWGAALPESDEFGYTGPPDPAKWAPYDGAGHDGNGTRDPERITVQDGYLRIEGLANGSTGGMAHVLDQTYGRWEVRARWLAASGATGAPYHGVLITWPYSDDDYPWPTGGELDFAEADIGASVMSAFMHRMSSDPGDQQEFTSGALDISEFHNYGFEWNADELIGYIDGVEWFRDSASDASPNIDMHLTVQLDNFTGSSGLQHGYLDAEWARVYPLVPIASDIAGHAAGTVSITGQVRAPVAVTGTAAGLLSITGAAVINADLGTSFMSGALGPDARLVVELAWGSDPNGDPALWTWSDITHDVQVAGGKRISITGAGRADEASTTASTSLALQLDNRAGRYTYGGQSPNWPNVRRGVPVRVRVDPLGAGWHIRYQGFVDGWVPSWDTSGRGAIVTLTASSTLRRQAQGTAPIQSALRRYITRGLYRNSVAGYWPCEDGKNSKRIESGVPGGRPMLISGQGEQPYPKFASSDAFICSADLPEVALTTWRGVCEPYNTGQGEVRFLMGAPELMNGTLCVIMSVNLSGSGLSRCDLIYTNNGDGCLHLAVYSVSGENVGESPEVDFNVNGGGVGTQRMYTVVFQQQGPDLMFGLEAVTVGYNTGTGVYYLAEGESMDGIASVTVAPGGDIDDTVIGHIRVGEVYMGLFAQNIELNAYTGETGYQRFSRLCEENDIAYEFLGAADVEMGPQRVADIATLLREVETADQGVLYDGMGPGLTYVTGYARVTSAPDLVLDVTAGQLVDELAPTDDDSRIVNIGTGKRTGGGEATVQDEDGPLGTHNVGDYDDTLEVNIADDSDVIDYAGWLVNLGTVEGYRFPQLHVNLAKSPELVPAWLATRLSARIDVTGVDEVRTQLAAGDLRLLLEGYTEEIDQFQWTVDLNCSPYLPWDVGVLADDLGDTGARVMRARSDGSALAAPAAVGASSLSVATPEGPLWTTTADDFPLDIEVGGIRVTVTAISGASSPQTFTVDPATVVKALAGDYPVDLWEPKVIGL